MSKIKINMISHLFPGNPAGMNPNSGIFLKNQLKEYRKYVDILLYVPVDITPSLGSLRYQSGILNKLKVLKDHFIKIIFKELSDFERPVNGKYVRFASIPPKSIFLFVNGIILFLRLIVCMRRENFDIVHGQTALPDGFAAIMLGKLFCCPSIITVRGSDVHSVAKGSLKYRIAMYALRKTNYITCVSEHLRNLVIDMGIEKKKVSTINNGVDISFSQKCDFSDIRKEYHIPLKTRILLYVGNLHPVKDPFTLLNAFEKVLRTYVDVHLIMVGSGVIKEQVHEYAHKLCLNEHIHFAGYQRHTRVADYMHICDMLCLSSLREGWPNVLLEAMLFGKPIVATNVGGVPEVVCSEKYGILVPPKKPLEMADAILCALNKKWNNIEIIRHACNYSWKNVAKRYYAVYQSLSN